MKQEMDKDICGKKILLNCARCMNKQDQENCISIQVFFIRKPCFGLCLNFHNIMLEIRLRFS